MATGATSAVEHPGLASVASLARKQLIAAGGGAICIYLDGEPVLDMWAGDGDPSAGTVWEADTMAMSWSTTKGVASTAVHLLADRGLLRYDDTLAAHWPEFAANGKQAITVRHLLSMEAGLYKIRHLIDDPRQMLDHDTMASLLAQAAPAHEPGARNAYHTMTYGWLVGELVRRITGVSLGTFVQNEIAAPLGLDGCYIGTPDDQIRRVAAFPEMPPPKPAVRLAAKAVNPVTSLFGVSLRRIADAFFPIDGEQVIATHQFLRAEVPSVNGVFTARSLARLYAALGNDAGLDGVQLWKPETRRAATTQQNDRRDRVIPLKVGWRLGYHQPFPKKKSSAESFGFYGAFGSGAFADPTRNLAVGLTVHQAKGLPLPKLLGPILEAADAIRNSSSSG